MSRIRSIHPGIWTDEDFAMLSMAARVLAFGIWTQADDHGIFEWKPLGLKMKIFPGDKVDVEPLLEELTTFNVVKKFSEGDRQYGAVRNFCRYQRPKKPSYKYLYPDEIGTYIGLKQDGSVPVPHQFGTNTENTSQRKEEGGSKKEKEKKEEDTASAVSTPTKYAFESGIIRLTQKDFEQWKSLYSFLDVPAELLSLTDFAQKNNEKWFFALQGALAKRNREVKAVREKNPDEFRWRSGIEGVV